MKTAEQGDFSTYFSALIDYLYLHPTCEDRDDLLYFHPYNYTINLKYMII